VKKIVIFITLLAFLAAPVIAEKLENKGKKVKYEKLDKTKGKGFKAKGVGKEKMQKLRGLARAIQKLRMIAQKMQRSGKREQAQKLFQKVNVLQKKLRNKLRHLKGQGKGQGKGQIKEQEKGQGKGKGKGN
jgi:hypothetical protein